MPLPLALGRFNRRVTNPLLGPVLLRLPGFGRVVHVGRRSGATYRTPMLAFRRGEQVTFVLTYGPGADWVQNVVSAGECRFETGRRSVWLYQPRVYRDPARRAVPALIRLALAVLGVTDFVELSTGRPQRIQNDRKLQRFDGNMSSTV